LTIRDMRLRRMLPPYLAQERTVLVNPHNDMSSQVPLCVDLDGTLTFADLSVESVLAVARRRPWLLLLLPVWYLRGRHHLKSELAARSELAVSVLPYDERVIALVEEARSRGRATILVTGSNRKFAEQVRDHLGIFDEVLASDESSNLSGARKAEKLSSRFGAGQYEYVADHSVDLPVWSSAAAAVTANASRSVVRRVAALGKPHKDLPLMQQSLRSWARALRLHQWSKNLLLFIPLITGHALFVWSALSAAVLAFLCFGLCASAMYIINDLLDLDADRHHREKRHRPFASGQLSIGQGLLASATMLSLGLGLALVLPRGFQISLATYIAMTLLYSFRLKQFASLDVLTLAGLYTLRVIAGTFAAELALSFWLLAFSMFVFLCLALVKRVAELLELRSRQQNGGEVATTRGREYTTEDVPILQILGATSGYLSVLVLALYINSSDVSRLYATPEILWLIAPLMLLWVTRLWIVASRGRMNEDPILFATKDPETWVTAVVTIAILTAATLLSLPV
jgi:4-hydroxybenzoate polyprenyltransferase/phosphoserine phosphatase